MSMRRAAVVSLTFLVVASAAEAGLPKPAALIERVSTSQSRGVYGLSDSKYNQASWGNRWKQSLGRPTIVVSPYVRGVGQSR